MATADTRVNITVDWAVVYEISILDSFTTDKLKFVSELIKEDLDRSTTSLFRWQVGAITLLSLTLLCFGLNHLEHKKNSPNERGQLLPVALFIGLLFTICAVTWLVKLSENYYFDLSYRHSVSLLSKRT